MRNKIINVEDLLKDYLPDPDQHAVLICLQFEVGELDNNKKVNAVFKLDEILCEIVEKTGVGKYDGNEFCEGPDEESVTFFIYGKDADTIHETISPVLSYLPKLPGSYILKRYGNYEGVREKKIFIK